MNMPVNVGPTKQGLKALRGLPCTSLKQFKKSQLLRKLGFFRVNEARPFSILPLHHRGERSQINVF